MKTNKSLLVYYKDRLVGTLALAKDQRIAFSYADSWLTDGFSVSPFSLPLKEGVFLPDKPYFQGLFGVFADSLPDAWGNLLVNRLLKKHGINPDQITPLDRLAIVGDSGMGALTYRPSQSFSEENNSFDLDQLASECQKVLHSEYSDKLDQLYRFGGTSGGARPKIMTELDGKHWIIKFPAHVDGADSGQMEYDYSLCARKCGIHMTETRLFPSKICKGYFGTVRFDRQQAAHPADTRIHMLTAAAMLELDFNQPSLDYHSLMKLTNLVTNHCQEDLENLFYRMCFNVFAHNRDDHSKNFTFLYEENAQHWRLSPAYDLTYSTTYYGEHTTSVDGNGQNPGKKELLSVGLQAGLSRQFCMEAIQQIQSKVSKMLQSYVL
ncbi:MAG: type II toxin-antitoxin system HipA family toxin [Lachnospiraceae bacterium]|nr:type II toxin-antitoxin system HipA family toxin [Lachnospiraceae bacterium]